jgi:hypothetical protein
LKCGREARTAGGTESVSRGGRKGDCASRGSRYGPAKQGGPRCRTCQGE